LGQRGGTLVAETVLDLSTQLAALAAPDLVRPAQCHRCGGDRLHVHDRRERHPRGGGGGPAVVPVLRFRCADEGCRAVWLVLPAFLARHLWRAWGVVEVATGTTVPAGPRVEVPARTTRRWLGRLTCAALILVQVLATSGSELQAALAQEAGLAATGQDLVCTFIKHTGSAHPMADLAAVIHRLSPGVRLM
jgi:hypothetical protein